MIIRVFCKKCNWEGVADGEIDMIFEGFDVTDYICPRCGSDLKTESFEEHRRGNVTYIWEGSQLAQPKDSQ